uniref:Uncharacterized protein n=1 Tax=Nomascus leucogenys TaxID=61853 RepID=A0A2I3HC99_NOMLE
MTKPIKRAFKSALLVGMWLWLVTLLVTSLFLKGGQKIIRLNRFLFYQFEFLFYQFECLLHGQQWTKCWV